MRIPQSVDLADEQGPFSNTSIPFCPSIYLVNRRYNDPPPVPHRTPGPTLCADHTLVALSHRNILILHEGPGRSRFFSTHSTPFYPNSSELRFRRSPSRST